MPETKPYIAVVDDEASVRAALERLCRAHGFDARSFATAHALVASLTDRRPDCVILDLQLPDCDGLDADAWLEQQAVILPIIIITGRDDVTPVSGAAVLRKPVDATTLLAEIERVLEPA